MKKECFDCENENVDEMLDNLSDAVKKASKALKGENNE